MPSKKHAQSSQIPAENLVLWHRDIARAVERMDSDEFPQLVIAAVNQIAKSDIAMAVVYKKNTQPIYICDTFQDERSRKALGRYITGTYVLNPVYNAFLAGLKTGAYRITDLAPDAYFSAERYQDLEVHLREEEELGYRTHGWPRGMEEVTVAIKLAEHEMLEISLSRLSSDGGFTDAKIEQIGTIVPLVAALFTRYWKTARAKKSATTPEMSLDRLFEEFGGDRLSPRERQVAQLVLKGHSSDAIGLHLNISLTTVKTHRKNFYTKLGISTQQELFTSFIKTLPLLAS